MLTQSLKSTIALVLLAFVLRDVAATTGLLVDKAKDSVKSSFSCRPEVMEIISKESPLATTSHESSPEMREICPNLGETCCSFDDLSRMKTTFETARKTVEEDARKFAAVATAYQQKEEQIKQMFAKTQKYSKSA